MIIGFDLPAAAGVDNSCAILNIGSRRLPPAEEYKPLCASGRQHEGLHHTEIQPLTDDVRSFVQFPLQSHRACVTTL